MEPKHLSYFKVENFKRFDSLEVKDIGQFNLVVGDNNVGKTSLLEALLFDDENYENFIIYYQFALENREIFIDNDNANFFDIYLNKSEQPIQFAYINSYSGNLNKLIITKKTRNELSEKEVDELRVKLKLTKSNHLLKFSKNGNNSTEVIELYDPKKKLVNFVPYLGAKIYYDEEIYDFLKTISSSNKKLENFKSDLKYFVPNLSAIEVSKSIFSDEFIFIIRESDSDSPKSLPQYGDGFIKFFRFLLKIEICENNRLMIDEIDTGIHYSRMKEFFKKVLQAAKNKNVQIFATTHSKECLVYFTKALEELGYQDNGRVIKIADTKSGIKAYTSRFAEFENSLFNDSEIR
jgi:AAA15 family ATPase/GTPase